MRRSAKALIALAVAGSCAPAFGAVPPETYENFTANTDTYWTFAGNTSGGQNYGWSNTDNTGTAVNPVGGTATGAGELGGTIARSTTANYYGFNTGAINPITDSFTASGVIRTMSRGGSSGFNLGFFGQGAGNDPIGSFGTGGNASNFIGINFDDGWDTWVNIFDVFTNRDRSNIPNDLVDPVANEGPGPAVAFSMAWSPAPAGASEKGQLQVSINGGNHIHNFGGDLNFLDLTHFGLLGISASGGNASVFLDDLTFSSYNPAVPPPPAIPEWKFDVTGDWGVGTNWVGNIAPNAIDATARFGTQITQSRLVYTNTNVTVGTLEFNNANTYLLAGLGTLTLQVSTGNAEVDVQQGSHKINLPVVVASNTTVNVAAGATLRVSDPVTVNAGILVGQTGAGTVIYESTVTLLPSSSLTFASSQHVAALTVGDNAKATLAANGSRVLEADALSISTTGGKVDLKDNKMIFRNQGPGTFTAGAYTGPSGLVDRGRGNASNAQWDGSGVVTSDTRAVNNNDLVSIGTARIGAIKGIANTATTTFAGQTVSGADTVAMVTWGGDANLDGKINIDDYGQIDFNVSSSGSVFGWYNGDFNYDGKINIDDYGIIDFNVTAQNSVFPTGGGLDGVAAVPEPASIGLVGLAAAGLVARRRRR